MSLLSRLFAKKPDEADALRPLYAAVTARGRDAFWYRDGHVPDTLDGRFDMIAAILSLVLIRMERDPEGVAPAAHVTELFISDMDGQLREIGIGDLIVGKHIGRMMSALGGRLGAYRDALEGGADLDEALARNLWRGSPPESGRVALVVGRLRAIHAGLAEANLADLLSGKLPPL